MKNLNQDYNELEDDLLPEYDIDYSNAKVNPYFRKDRTFIEVDSDIAQLFENSENINAILRVIAKSISKKSVVASY